MDFINVLGLWYGVFSSFLSITVSHRLLQIVLRICPWYQTDISLHQRCTTFLGQGPHRIIFSALEGQRQNYELKFRESSIKKSTFLNLTSLFTDYSLIFLSSELLRIVISCKIVNSSIKFKFIHKFFLIQEKFLVFFKLLRGPDITRSGAGSLYPYDRRS